MLTTALGLALAACTGAADSATSVVTSSISTVGGTSTRVAAGTGTATTATATTATATTAGPTTEPAPALAASSTAHASTTVAGEAVEIGRSVQGRPITAVRRGTPGGRVVLVVGAIHGDEAAGVAVIDRLTRLPVPEGVDLWLVDSMNPDGVAAGTRGNASGVDLNRNFPNNWAPLGEPGVWEYGGPSEASEPETQAMVWLVERIRPALTLWYHQAMYRISPGRGRAGEVRRRYAELTGLPLLRVSGGTYTGTASPWVQAAVPGAVSFIVELGPTLSPEEADRHAAAVLALAPG